MADYTSLAIGINRYQYAQPLSYAQEDAQAVHQRLREETGLPIQQSLLLSDTSPWVGEQSTEPTKANILHWVDNWLGTQKSSLLWFFFSGYGVSWEGEDYFMPIDGNPADIPNTGILATDLFNRIREKGFKNVLALLDINRSPGVIAGESVGAQIAEIAPEYGISLILSSQLEEASHEEVSLGHGIFTATLLEALRYYGPNLTLHNLSGYLYEHLPELSEHHWRPVQHPLIIIPSIEFAQKPLLPQTASSAPSGAMVAGAAGAAAAGAAAIASSPPTQLQEPMAEEEEPDPETSTEPKTPSPQLPNFTLSSSFEENLEGNNQNGESEETEEAPEPEENETETEATPPPAVTSLRRRRQKQTQQLGILIGGSIAFLIAALGLFWFWQSRTSEDPVVNSGNEGQPTTSPTPGASPSPNGESAPQDSLAPAEPTLEASQRVLAKAKTYIQSNQASGFSRAIAEAQRIQPNAPLYQEAQEDISRWSAVILDIAQGRANQGNFDSAIAAAKLIPQNDGNIHAQAQQRVEQWQQQKQQQAANTQIIQSARRMIRYTQASSYAQGIAELQKIPSGQPGYAQAQQLIANWSEQMYLIANSRAARGNFSQAVQSAKLIPQGTPSYDKAQKAIARWQEGKN